MKSQIDISIKALKQDGFIIGFPQKQVGRRDFPDVEQANIASGWHQSINGDRCFIVDKGSFSRIFC